MQGALAAALTAALVAGCGGGDDGTDSTTSEAPGPGLAAGLDGINVADTEAPVAIQWADVARLREAADLPESAVNSFSKAGQRWSIPLGYALGSPIGDSIGATDFGFDPMTGNTTVAIGSPPRKATVYEGVDAGGATAAFEKLGFNESGDFLAQGGEGDVEPDTSAEDFQQILIGINRVAIDGDRIAVGAYEDPVEAALGRGGEPVLDQEGVAAAADCLGDGAIVADVADPDPDDKGLAADDVGLRAIGFGMPDESDTVSETLCAVTDGDASLDHVKDCMDGNFNDGGVDPFTNQPYEDELGPADVTTGETDGTAWVKATFERSAKDPMGLLLNLDSKGVLSGPLGGEPYGFSGPSVTPEQLKNLESTLPKVC